MALNHNEDVQDISDRFGIAQDEPVLKDIRDRQQVQVLIRARIYTAATEINETVADSREKSLALTKLEEALMWAGKAIFK